MLGHSVLDEALGNGRGLGGLGKFGGQGRLEICLGHSHPPFHGLSTH